MTITDQVSFERKASQNGSHPRSITPLVRFTTRLGHLELISSLGLVYSLYDSSAFDKHMGSAQLRHPI